MGGYDVAADRAAFTNLFGQPMKDYHINVFFSEEDDCYVADIPDLKYCSAFGDTPQEALREIQIAKRLWLEVAREKGRPIPVPTYRPGT